MEVKGTILAKKSDNKAFKLSDDSWYNLNDNVIPVLEKISKGDFVTVQYEKKGVSRYVSNLTTGQTSIPKEEPKTETKSDSPFACSVCGVALKDGKFKKCFKCNQAAKAAKEGTTEVPHQAEPTSEFTCEECGAPLKTGKYKKCYKCGKKGKTNSYDSPEKTAQIQRGNALNAAAAVASSQQFEDPETAKQFTLLLAEDFLLWLRGE
jgi:hypothetical protein